MNCGVCAGRIEYVGKRRHQQSGKYRVNENDEEKLSRAILPVSFRDGALAPDPEISRFPDAQLRI